MSWLTGSLVSIRERFALAALARREPFVQLCRRFHIVRSAGYKWVQRFRRHGRAGLRDHSRRPHRSPRQLARRWPAALGQLRLRHPTWGPRKLRARLRQLHPRVHLPVPRPLARAPNDVWTLDFKGWFRTGDGTRVEPLSVRDLTSRFLLDGRLLPNPSDAPTRRALPRVFRRYGLPKVIRVDNGAPVGGVGPRGLSRLSVWWRRRGLRVEFGRPAHPEDNAAHEQMHGVYQAEVADHPAAHPRAHQRRSDRWRANYNQIRPHEALGLRPPAGLYRVSPRPLPKRLPDWTYPAAWCQRRVSPDGRLFWQGRQRFIGRAFGGEIIGLQRQPAGVWKIFLGTDLLGLLYPQDRSRSLRPARQLHHGNCPRCPVPRLSSMSGPRAYTLRCRGFAIR